MLYFPNKATLLFRIFGEFHPAQITLMNRHIAIAYIGVKPLFLHHTSKLSKEIPGTFIVPVHGNLIVQVDPDNTGILFFVDKQSDRNHVTANKDNFITPKRLKTNIGKVLLNIFHIKFEKSREENAGFPGNGYQMEAISR